MTLSAANGGPDADGTATARLSRWHRVFATALEKQPAVGVHLVLVEYLQRAPSRSEAIAARRAAHSFAAAGRARVEYADVVGHGDRRRLVLVRPGAGPMSPELLAAAVVTTTPPVARSMQATHTEAGRRLVETVREAAMQSRHIRVDVLTRAESADLATSLASVLRDLGNLRRRLTRESQRKATPAVVADDEEE